MSVVRPLLRPSLLVWFGVGAAPVAWTVQHVTGFAFTQAQCERSGTEWRIPLDPWFIGVSAATALVAVGGIVAAVAVWRATADAGEEPPASRVHFLSVVGMASSPLFLFMILMSGLGSTLLPQCVQG